MLAIHLPPQDVDLPLAIHVWLWGWFCLRPSGALGLVLSCLLYTYRPAGALVRLLYTYRPAGALVRRLGRALAKPNAIKVVGTLRVP